jgi:uncharacterized membrane protein
MDVQKLVGWHRKEGLMNFSGISDRFSFFYRRLHERLWVKPLASSVLSIVAVLLAKGADLTDLAAIIPQISKESLETILLVMASSMLVIATFAVGAMVAAYASASNTASPRTLALVIADDVSQHALSTFVGAFIFSIVGLLAVKENFLGIAGHFVLFLLSLIVFGIVIFTFLRWVDRIARLGRLGQTICKVEDATAQALEQRRQAPTLRGRPLNSLSANGQAVLASRVGYLQRIDMDALQSIAVKAQSRISVAVLPGSMVAPGRVLACVRGDFQAKTDFDCKLVAQAFIVGKERIYYTDPRYGLVVLSQIAGRALSPAVNDPGTAIDIIVTLVRLFAMWGAPQDENNHQDAVYDRVEVPELSVRDMFDDAFQAIAHDGSGAIEVCIRLLKALSMLASMGNAAMRDAAVHHARRLLAYAERGLALPEDMMILRELADFLEDTEHQNLH